AGNAVYAALIDTTRAPAAIGALLAIEAMSAPALSAVYLLLTCRLAHQYGDHPLVQRVAGAGRMSLTMYLGQGAVANALFMGWGLGWFGRLGPMALLALAPVLYTVLVWLAARWQSHFRLGPDEWLLRSLTYWRWEAMRRATS
ncbi:MAG: DUF418 domain-containing protein, partial [Gemmatimonadaceae bacterium]|nr:DUF418 domain-containing protein [Gemmatimonadaceae bacterium]